MTNELTMTDAHVKEATEKLSTQLRADRVANNAFCDCWPCAKRILNLLKGVVPAPIKGVIDLLIKIGDGVSGSVCK
jgi:hypothetical protein